jgi:hypothetical protein
MKNIKYLLLLAFLTPMLVLAQDGSTGGSAENIVLWLTPFIVLGATALIKVVKPLIPGWATLIVVTGLSAAVAWVSELTVGGDASFIIRVGAGLLSVVIHQIYRQFNQAN